MSARGHTGIPGPIDSLLAELATRRGTDLLLTAGAPPWLRIDGALVALGTDVLTPEDTEHLVLSLLSEDLTADLKTNKDVDFSFNWQGRARFRGNAFRQRGSMGLALRLIPYEIPSMEDLGLPDGARRMADLTQGLVLVTGPTGSGKSTTLASMIDHINATRAVHILTIEDPIEYVYRHKRSAVNQREIGEDATTFARAMRAALREDPDVLLVGELRDLETIQSALTLAETGHLVLGTLHTNDTSQAIDRIVDVFPGSRQTQIRVQLAGVLSGAIYQQLLPKIGGGRVAVYEVLVATYPVRNLIKEGKTRQLRSVLAMSGKDGMQTFETCLTKLVEQGILEHTVAVAHSLYPNEVPAPR
jgi:twitching motility protein PilT